MLKIMTKELRNIQRFFSAVKIENLIEKKNVIFDIVAQNIYNNCGYTLEPPWQGGSNEYPQSMI